MVSNRIYNTDKVEDKIGLPGVKYDKIDVFVDQSNKNNVWGIVYYTEFYKNKPVVKEKIVNFNNFNDMINFIKNNFDGYELSHQVDYSLRHIFFHNVDYLGIDYYLHDGKPDLNYFELNYKEYVNGGFQTKKKRFSKEYENMFLHIVKVNKGLTENTTTNMDIINTIDVYVKKEKTYETSHRALQANLSHADKVKKRKLKQQVDETKKKKRIKNLKIVISTVTLGTILIGGGYKIMKDISTYKREFITQNNLSINVDDIDIYINKGRANAIIENLMNDNYENVSTDDLKYILKYIAKVEKSNYDYNNSTALFNYTEYFTNKIYELNQDVMWEVNSDKILSKIEELYNGCFASVNNIIVIKKNNVKKYIDYVASLTFMYDTIVDMRGSNQVPMETQSITSIYASKEEIETYNRFPLILKYTILNQLKTVMQHANYSVSVRPSYYFKDLDKSSLITEISSIMEEIADNLKISCSEKGK